MSDRTAGSSDPTLVAAVAAVARDADEDETLHTLLGIGAGMIGATLGAAYLWDADRGALALAGAIGVPPERVAVFESAVADPGNPVTRAAMERIRILDAPMHFPEGDGIVAAWPIVIARDGVEEPVGAVAFSRSVPWAIDPIDAERVGAIADLVALTVDRARTASLLAERAEWFERVSHSDALTGLANPRTLRRVLDLELARAGRQGGEVSVALFDVDGLEAINARLGRPAGDDVLREVAAIVAESVRLVDTVARSGGDEFILVAPGSAGVTVAQRIVEAARHLTAADGSPVSLSVGVARFPVHGSTSEELIDAATAALGGAKDGADVRVSEAGSPA